MGSFHKIALAKCFVLYSAIKFVLSQLTLPTFKKRVCYNLRIFLLYYCLFVMGISLLPWNTCLFPFTHILLIRNYGMHLLNHYWAYSSGQVRHSELLYCHDGLITYHIFCIYKKCLVNRTINSCIHYNYFRYINAHKLQIYGVLLSNGHLINHITKTKQ
jgi:hypothetical protein